jgi:8-amino-7-oxononanoate synthase
MSKSVSTYNAAIQEDFGSQGKAWDPQDILLQSPSARRWMRHIEDTVHKGWYTYQLPLSERRGAKVCIKNRWVTAFSSYDYLGLLGHPDVNAAAKSAIDRYGTGAGGVRLLSGSLETHEELEHILSKHLQTESAVVFSCGYMANLALIPTLLQHGDIILADEYAHRSLRESTKLGTFDVHYFKHNCMEGLEHLLRQHQSSSKRICILVEGVYSMDGDICPLPQIRELKKRYGALLVVDEAHSLGVLGNKGQGVFEHFKMTPTETEILTGSLAKAIPSCGGFVAGARRLLHLLRHDAPPFIFSAALSPADTSAAIVGVQLIRDEGWRRIQVQAQSARIRLALQKHGLSTGLSESPVIPVMFSSTEAALHATHSAWVKGLAVNAVTYPAVPRTAARIRLCITAAHDDDNLDALEKFFEHWVNEGSLQS